ncbi:MAG: alpha-hydroxy-acid oxidizing protein [Gammaproteobacteria bacterium]|jgi:isopentenyl diphosphate isomerase/L-lactate dehydrogenase-like FMN-dependent dehydrogenase|nr:alpha-hydroxy-acid oxidizing protein [Gammaproteobacteria bacterium]MBT5601519.1 alpha-hydroxy-acid oxidizing protein [Gammaproteobacteria bacterium]MBT6245753.1 alpha-hydroxy-acid oxidizing protein [Gammaproteobacteria bacterium]
MPDSKFKTIHEIVKAARLNLNQTHWDYLIGGTETETTLKRNRASIDARALRPKVLNDVSNIDTRVEFMGKQMQLPVILAPIGSLQVFNPEGGAAAAIAAEQAGIMSIASSVCTPDIEAIADASNSAKIYQLYVRGDEHWQDEIIKRVIDSGYIGFCLTVDTAVVSRRERDIAKGVIPTSPASPGDFNYQAKLNWKDVARIKEKHDIPLILKGINRADDAEKALAYGVDVIYVSNHGGRQLDQGAGSLDLLPDIVEAVAGRAEIIIDGGFYRGTDILKAMAMGANAVGLGRLEAWALAAGGSAALVRCLAILRHEIIESLALCGVTAFKDLDNSFVNTAINPNPSSLQSAFPLLDLSNAGY